MINIRIIWVYATEPRTLREVATSAQVAAGTYEIDAAKFEVGRELFRQEKYAAARELWRQADPAERDARTQFYIAYAFYREGWGRVYSDDALFKQGLEAINRAIDSAGNDAPLKIDDANLQLRAPAELKAELEAGTQRSWSDLNPLKVLRERK
jgi:tetratricopeptide (TPR) repeat protein